MRMPFVLHRQLCPWAVRAVQRLSRRYSKRFATYRGTIHFTRFQRPCCGAQWVRIADDWADLLDDAIDNTLLSANAISDTYFQFHSGSNSDGSVTSNNCNGYDIFSFVMSSIGLGNRSWTWMGSSTMSCASGQLLCLCY